MGHEVSDRIQEYIDNLGYKGPVGLSCDDTQLHPAFRTFWNAATKTHMLVGSTKGPLAIASPEHLEALVNDPSLHKATKVSSSQNALIILSFILH